MYAAEVEKGHIQIHGGAQMFERLAESETQPSEAAKMRTHAQIRSFDVAGRNASRMRVSDDGCRDRCGDLGGRIPLWPLTITCSVHLDQLREINVGAEIFFDSRYVGFEAVRCDLKMPIGAVAQIADKFVGTRGNSLADKVGQNQFRFAVNCHPNVLVAPLFCIAGKQVPFFGVNEGPKFIGLDESRTNAANLGVKKFSGLLAKSEEKRKNRALVDACNARHRTDANSFEQEFYDLRGCFGLDVVTTKRLLARLREGSFTSRAAEALDSFPSVKPESLRFGMLTTDARHGLLFLRKKPYNQSLGFECGPCSRLNHAPSLAETSGGVLFFLSSRRWKRRQFVDPTICRFIFRCHRIVHFSFEDQSLQNRVNRCEQVSGISFESESFQPVFNLLSVQRSTMCFQGHSDRISESKFIIFVEAFSAESRQGRNRSSQLHNSIFQFLLFLNGGIALPPRYKKVTFRIFEGYAVIAQSERIGPRRRRSSEGFDPIFGIFWFSRLFFHDTGGYTVARQRVKNILHTTDKNRWQTALADAEAELRRVKSQAQKLEMAVQTFKDRIAQGAPWPGSATQN